MEIDGKYIIGSKEALSLAELPKKIIIIGSGAIGCEFAFYFNSFGADVELIEMQNRILPMEDADISDALKENFLAAGIKVHNNSNVRSIEKLKNSIRVNIETEKEQLQYGWKISLISSWSCRKYR